MGKRASGSQDQISSLQEGLKRARRRKTPDDGPALPSSSTTTTQAAQIHRPSRPRKRKAAEDDVRPMPELSSCTNQAAQIQILPSWVAAEPKSIPCNLRPCSAAAAQVRLRPPSSATSLFWGAKRSRTSLGRRDWSNLDDGPAGLIAERLLANDVADYIGFRAVCRPWRRCCSDPRLHAVLEDRRFHPRRWIMLLAENEQLQAAAPKRCRRRHFLNVSTGQCIQVDIPELRDNGVLRSTTEGLLLLLCNATEPVRLLNPLTRQVAELPPITTISGLDLGAGGSSPGYIGDRCSPSSAGLVDDHTVLLYFYEDGILAFAKPGDERWVVVETNRQLMPTMSFAGRFYGVTTDAVMMVDTTRADLPPRLVVAANLARPVCRMADTVHLVDNGGELVLVHRRLMPQNRSNTHKRAYKVYRVNLVARKTTPAAAARGRAIFIGLFRALSVPPHVFPSLSANTVYPGLMCGERDGDEQIGAYHLKDGSTEPFNYDSRRGLEHPWTIADCLAAYVSG